MKITIHYAVGTTEHAIEAEIPNTTPRQFAKQLGDLRERDNVPHLATPQGGEILAAREIVAVKISL